MEADRPTPGPDRDAHRTAELRDGDYYGTAVNRASRVMAAAHGGQAVLSHASAELVRGGLTDGLDLLDLGEHRLKGLARSEHIYQLAIAGLRTQFPPLQSVEAFPGRLPLPLTPFARDDQALAGREVELEVLDARGRSRLMVRGRSR